MNKNLPEGIVDMINSEIVTCCKFNSFSTILAAGCYDGKAVLFDWSIKGVLRSGIAHNKPISKIDWSSLQDKVATACVDGIVVVWSIPSFRPTAKFVLKRSFSSVNSLTFSKIDDSLLLCTNNSVFLLSENQIQKAILDESISSFCGTFLNTSNHYIVGDCSGNVSLYFNVEKLFSFKCSNYPISTISLHPDLDEFLFNQSETIIRSCSIDTKELKFQLNCFKFSNEIDRTKWFNFIYLSNGLFVAATCSNGISLWDSIEGHFCGFYEDSPKEGISFLLAVPKSNDFIGISNSGYIYIWSKKRTDNWAAYAPNFTPIEENVEYFEREDEFDIDLETGLPVAYSEVEDKKEELIEIGSAREEKEKFLNFPQFMNLFLDNLNDEDVATYLSSIIPDCKLIQYC